MIIAARPSPGITYKVDLEASPSPFRFICLFYGTNLGFYIRRMHFYCGDVVGHVFVKHLRTSTGSQTCFFETEDLLEDGKANAPKDVAFVSERFDKIFDEFPRIFFNLSSFLWDSPRRF